MPLFLLNFFPLAQTPLTLVKIGGKVLNDSRWLTPVLDAFAQIPGTKVLVHGGGKAGSDLAQRLGVASPMISGRRITSEAMLDVALMAFGGLMNRKLVAALQGRGLNAAGFTGADLDLVRARKRPVEDIDYGLVGDIDQVNAAQLAALLEQGVVPILAPLTHDGQGQLLNTNADTIAATVASALADRFAVQLVFAFERPGVLRDASDDKSLILRLSASEAQALQAQGAIADGMLPKLHNAFMALAQGVQSVVIGRPVGKAFQGTVVVQG